MREIGIRAFTQHRADAKRTNAFGEARVSAVYREIWTEAARCLGASIRDLGGGFLEISRASASTRVWRHHVMLDTDVALRLALDKSVMSRILVDAGLPVAEHVALDSNDVGPALALIDAGPCVVKPARGTSGGFGVTCGVQDIDELTRACIRARRTQGDILIESMVVGNEVRLLFLDGELLDVLQRHPPTLLGDGKSTVSTLISEENRRRRDDAVHAGLSHIHVDLDCVLALAHQGLSLHSTPADGQRVVVKSAVNENGPADNSRITEIDRALVTEAAEAVRLSGLRLAAVELVSKRLDRPLAESGGVILEVNGTPGLHYHYEIANRDQAVPVALSVLERVLSGRGCPG
jgi:cyanophycin synthetase